MTTQRSGLLERAAATAQFLVDDLDSPELDDADRHHLVNVLRSRPGESIALVDGRGSWRMATWTGSRPDVVGESHVESTLDPTITVGFSLLKGDKTDWVAQKLTEIGVDVLVPLSCARTVVRWDDKKAARNLERLRRVVYEAAMQSRRVRLPVVEAVQDVRRALEAGMIPAHPGGEAVDLLRPSVAVGPEGGFSAEELVIANRFVDLGPTILRAETAATTVGVLLSAMRTNSADFRPSVTGQGETDRVRASKFID